MHEHRPAILLCSDWRAEAGDLAGGDVEDKLTWITPKRWAALKAGIISEADKLAVVYRTVFSTLTMGLTRETALPILNATFNQYRALLINDYLGHTFGIDYAQLLSGVRASAEPGSPLLEFPESFVERTLADIERVPYPNCQLILAGFTGDHIPVVCILNEPPSDGLPYSRVRLEANFCATGSGAAAATMSMYRRRHIGSETNLMKAAYHVYEAKLLSEVSPGVGDITSITVLFPDGECWDLSSKGHEYLYNRFKYFGPMEIGSRAKRPKLKAPHFEFRDEFFEEYEPQWPSPQPQPSGATAPSTDQT